VTAWYFGFWIVVLYLAFTIVDLPYFAWGAELSPLYDERTKITARREQFHFLGTITFNLLPLAAATLIYFSRADFTSVSELPDNFTIQFVSIMAERAGHIDVILNWLANFVLVLIPVTFVMAISFVPEPDQQVIPRRKPTFLASLRVVKRNGPFLRLIVCYTVSVLGAGMTAAAFFGFDPLADPDLAGTAEGNSQAALLWLAVLYSIVPAGFKFIALPVIWNYPLTEERQVRSAEHLIPFQRSLLLPIPVRPVNRVVAASIWICGRHAHPCANRTAVVTPSPEGEKLRPLFPR
jgi:Na+/melibiose symporter-like transporter